MNTQEQVQILAAITTRDEAGRHFSEVYAWPDLEELEAAGLLAITRPVHEATVLPYSQEHYSVEVTDEGQALVECWPEYWPRPRPPPPRPCAQKQGEGVTSGTGWEQRNAGRCSCRGWKHNHQGGPPAHNSQPSRMPIAAVPPLSGLHPCSCPRKRVLTLPPLRPTRHPPSNP